MRRSHASVSATSIIVLVAVSANLWARDGTVVVGTADPLPYVRIYHDSEGESHFEDDDFHFRLVDFAPPAPPISVSQTMDAERVVVITSASGWHGDWHPVPEPQLMFVLAGRLEVTVSDGETRQFGPGDVLLVEDTAGKGHVSTVVSKDRCVMASVPLKN